jgi:hypothetical protein
LFPSDPEPEFRAHGLIQIDNQLLAGREADGVPGEWSRRRPMHDPAVLVEFAAMARALEP